MSKFFAGFFLALLMVAIVIIAFMATPTRPPKRSKRQPAGQGATIENLYDEAERAG